MNRAPRFAALLLALIALAAPLVVHAQSQPVPVVGGNAQPVGPGDDGSLNSTPPHALPWLVTGSPIVGFVVTAWIPERRIVSTTPTWLAALAPRPLVQRRTRSIRTSH